ncbi:hypothetical protein FC40_GL000213 [Ligilactobacillus hayakitensis DSM 18933 = JCM 14209]|uniref:Uncharacterized protein n=1 Tax=Ligilactobacillus hayakitensis DSM 18933 = JCM 14209 TaxID=1423755 RepID=A0A0R1WZI7_9LACO|nr:type II toxin-antitoxin system PemK/MazF family toxin [Ligilactobacillus hayakitensis]KRM20294.1 hypothetical protein FC40_GL000213 [Ligilactobacillus hayakitensis DSM 18933 = JCM 14209]
MNLKVGDIVFLSNDPKPQNNNEQKGGRPWLVLSVEGFNQVTPFVWAVPFTTSERDYPLAYKWDVEGKTSGTLLCDQLTTLDVKHRDYQFIEHVKVPNEVMNNIRAVLNI